MIEVLNLTKQYAGNTGIAVDDVSFTVNSGEIFGFLGPNGAGKSTTIKCMTGILAPTSGKIFVDGVDITENPDVAKMKMGFVPDEHVIYEGLTGTQYINFISDIFGVPSEKRKANTQKFAAAFGMTDSLKDLIASYSHGMKQKINIIAALVHEPDVFILDEPMTGLDPQSSFRLKTIMNDYAASGKTVFFSSHVLEVVEKLCTKVAIINGGKLLTVCDIKELHERRSDMSLEQLFFNLIGENTGSEL